jgi:hypothetical protein
LPTNKCFETEGHAAPVPSQSHLRRDPCAERVPRSLSEHVRYVS